MAQHSANMGCANIYLQFSKAKEQMLAIQYSQTQRTRIKKVNLETWKNPLKPQFSKAKEQRTKAH